MAFMPDLTVQCPEYDADLEGIAELLESAFGNGPDWKSQVAWQYLLNPLGKSWVANARHPDGSLLAHVAFMPLPCFAQPMWFRHPVFFSLNTAVRRDAGIPGLFPVLGRKLLQVIAKELGEFTVLGVSNENSTDGFIRLLGFKDLGPMQLKAFLPWALPRSARTRALESTEEHLAWRMSRPGCSYRLHSATGLLMRRMYHKGIPVDAILSADDFQPSNEWKPGRSSGPAMRLYAVSGRESPGGIEVPGFLRPSPLRQILRTFPAKDTDSMIQWLEGKRFEFLDFDVV